jgi:hypothetical protein
LDFIVNPFYPSLLHIHASTESQFQWTSCTGSVRLCISTTTPPRRCIYLRVDHSCSCHSHKGASKRFPYNWHTTFSHLQQHLSSSYSYHRQLMGQVLTCCSSTIQVMITFCSSQYCCGFDQLSIVDIWCSSVQGTKISLLGCINSFAPWRRIKCRNRTVISHWYHSLISRINRDINTWMEDN